MLKRLKSRQKNVYEMQFKACCSGKNLHQIKLKHSDGQLCFFLLVLWDLRHHFFTLA